MPQYHNKRYFASSGPRHLIPRRSLAPRLLVTWLATVVMAVLPFIWYHFVSSSSATNHGTANTSVRGGSSHSKVRKLALLVFMLSYALPVVASLSICGFLVRTWVIVRRECSLAVVIRKSGLQRTSSGISRRSVRGPGSGGVRSRQGSVRASRRSRGGGTQRSIYGGGPGGQTGGGPGGAGSIRMSPQLDRHPSVRYSIRRNRGGGRGGGGPHDGGSRSSIDRDSAEASLLAEVLAAENAAAANAAASATTGRSSSVFDDQTLAHGPQSSLFQHTSQQLQQTGNNACGGAGSRRESFKSNQSSRSDRGGGGAITSSGIDESIMTSSAKTEDPSPTRRFLSRQQQQQQTIGGGAYPAERRSTGGSGGDFLFAGLQEAQHRPPLSSQRSNPEVATLGSSPPDITCVGLSPRGSRDELVKALIGGSTVKKRSFVRRHSSRARRSQQPSGQDSPKLDRHPSLRYSTTRLQATPSLSSRHGAGGGSRTVGGPGGSLFSRRGVASCSTLSVGRNTTAAAFPANQTSSRDRKESSGSNASSSIGTCHDLLQPSTSAYSMSRTAGGGGAQRRERPLDSTGSSPETDCEAATGSGSHKRQGTQRRSAEDDQALLADRARRNISNVNLLRLAPSDRDVSGTGAGGIRRNRSAEDFGSATLGFRSSSNRLSPASCRRQPRRPSPEMMAAFGPGGGSAALGTGWSNSSNHHLHHHLSHHGSRRGDRSPSDVGPSGAGSGGDRVPFDSVGSGDRYLAGGGQGASGQHGPSGTDAVRVDVLIIVVVVLILVLLWTPALITEFTAVMKLTSPQTVAGNNARKFTTDNSTVASIIGSSLSEQPQQQQPCVGRSGHCFDDTWRLCVGSLHVFGYIGGLVRPALYQVFNRTLRLALWRIICRH